MPPGRFSNTGASQLLLATAVYAALSPLPRFKEFCLEGVNRMSDPRPRPLRLKVLPGMGGPLCVGTLGRP